MVVGGGLAGLVVAHELARAGRDVALLEAADTLGGQVRTERVDGCVIEHGAEGFIARSEAVPALARNLGIEADLIGQSTLRSFGYRDGALHALAPGEAGAFLGLQVPEEDLGKGIRSFRGGMGALTEALAVAVRAHAQVTCNAAVVRIDRMKRGFSVRCGDGAAIDAERIVVATSARTASLLLAPLVGDVAHPLATAPTLSSVTATVAHPRHAVANPLDATGFVVAPGQGREGLRACTFVTSKFTDRAPDDTVLLRLFFRPTDDEETNLDDETWTARAGAATARVLDLAAIPRRAWVSRWPDALPVHTAAHRQHTAALEAALSDTGVLLAGSAFHGSGIDAAVRSARRAADALV